MCQTERISNLIVELSYLPVYQNSILLWQSKLSLLNATCVEYVHFRRDSA